MAVDGLVAARKRQVDDMIFLAHQTATLNAYAYHKPKSIPGLEKLMKPEPAIAGRAQTPDEQIAVLKSIMSNRKR